MRRYLTLVLALLAHALAVAQTPLRNPALQLFAPARVDAVAYLPDGSVLLGGLFSFVNGVERQNIALLNADGSLNGWNPGADGRVWAFAVDSTGNVYLAGGFGKIANLSRAGLAKLVNGALSVDPSWDPGATNFGAVGGARTLAIDGAGNLYVAGSFTAIGGYARHGLAKLAPSTGGADATWDPSPDQAVNTLVLDGKGFVYAGGTFSYIGGVNTAYLARLSDAGIGSADSSWTPLPNNQVDALAIDAQGELFAGGQFTQIGTLSRLRLAKFSGASTALDATWNPGVGDTNTLSDDVNALIVSNNSLYVGGSFLSIAGQSRSNAARLSTTGAGTFDSSWNLAPNSSVQTLAQDSSGSVTLGGIFTDVSSLPALGVVSITSTGTISAHADAEVPGTVYALAAQPAGGVIAGGDFVRAGTAVRRSLLRLLPDGSLDSVWQANTDGRVYSLATASNGDVYAGGLFGYAGDQIRPSVAKFSGSGAGNVDLHWLPASANGFVTALTVDSLGHVFVGGTYVPMAKLDGNTGSVDASWTGLSGPFVNSIYALARDSHDNVVAGGDFTANNTSGTDTGIARLFGGGAGGIDWTWSHAADSPVFTVFVDRNDVVYFGGAFTSVDSIQRSHIARMSSYSGDAFNYWYPEADGPVYSFAEDFSGMVYAGGYFANIGGAPRSNIARLSAQNTGQADSAWNPGADSAVLALATDAGGILYIGGAFQSIDGVARGGLAAFATDCIFRDGFE